jgi:acyl-CoA synthetase (AMP-forming)/AMP-acid ligase II
VYPKEVEEVLLTHPAVAEVAIVGMPDPKWGEMGIAVIVRRDGMPAVSEAELLGHLDGRCAKYRWPREFFFWDVMPKSGYGKIVKKDIKSLLVERGEFKLPEQLQ